MSITATRACPRHLAAACLAALVAVAVAVPAQQGAPSADPARHMHPSRTFSLVLPPGWRQLTPDEALQLQHRQRAAGTEKAPRIPPDLLLPTTAAFYPYGDIEGWLAGRFDGRCLTVQQVDGECSTDEAGLAAIRGFAEADGAGWRREILAAELTELGPSDHPAIECSVRMLQDGLPAIVAMVLFVPTAGHTLVLSFRCWESDLADANGTFGAAAATLTFAREPRGPHELSDHLMTPLLVGALVGILLLVMSKRRRNTAA